MSKWKYEYQEPGVVYEGETRKEKLVPVTGVVTVATLKEKLTAWDKDPRIGDVRIRREQDSAEVDE